MEAIVLRSMLGRLRISQGCDLVELSAAVPREYIYTHYVPEYLALEAMCVLVKWGLAEAYQGDRELSHRDLAQFTWRSWPADVRFYVSKTTLEIEEAFAVRLEAAPVRLFGERRRELGPPLPEVFVLMPFNQDLWPIYETHIRKVVVARGLSVGRADDFFSAGFIMGEIWMALNGAKLTIADCTGRNANVFYEVGLAHALGRETILLAQSIDDIPFDLQHLRIIVYGRDAASLGLLEEALGQSIDASLAKWRNELPNKALHPTGPSRRSGPAGER